MGHPPTSGLTLTGFAGNASEFVLHSLAALTGTPGDYQLTFNGTAVTDTGGNPVTGSVTDTWHLESPPVIGSFNDSSILEGTSFLLTDSFTTPEQNADPFGDFLDGVYQYTLHSAKITNGSGSPLAGGDQTRSFRKLYGASTTTAASTVSTSSSSTTASERPCSCPYDRLTC